jgi:hypothetical protein
VGLLNEWTHRPRLAVVALILNNDWCTQMKMLVSLTRLRRSTAVRTMAVVLLVLAVSPVTAPFATFDFADLAGDAPIHGDPLSSSKAPKEGLTTAIVSASLAPLFVVLYHPLGTPTGRVGSSQVLQTVLRL